MFEFCVVFVFGCAVYFELWCCSRKFFAMCWLLPMVRDVVVGVVLGEGIDGSLGIVSHSLVQRRIARHRGFL